MSNTQRKLKIGDLVIYQGLVGRVDRLSETVYGVPTLGLVSIEDKELTCTAREVECEFCDNPDEVDQDGAIYLARLESEAIARRVDRVTDKYVGD
jgi:hypothetical protein